MSNLQTWTLLLMCVYMHVFCCHDNIGGCISTIIFYVCRKKCTHAYTNLIIDIIILNYIMLFVIQYYVTIMLCKNPNYQIKGNSFSYTHVSHLNPWFFVLPISTWNNHSEYQGLVITGMGSSQSYRTLSDNSSELKPSCIQRLWGAGQEWCGENT